MIISKNNGDYKVLDLNYKISCYSVFLAKSEQKYFDLPHILLLKSVLSMFWWQDKA